MRAARLTRHALPFLNAALFASSIQAQTPLPRPGSPGPQNQAPLFATSDQQPVATTVLPDAPGWTLPPPPHPLPPCAVANTLGPPTTHVESLTPTATVGTLPAPAPTTQPCIQISPYHRFLDNTTPIPLTPRQKAYLAFHNFKDPFNLITIVGTAAFTIGTNSHTAYGPGMKGFGLNTGYSVSQDVTGEFFGTFLIPSLVHEDPHYHREPQTTIPRRILHAISRTVIAQHDDGSLMPNYAVLLTYPITAEITNLYVPGVNTSAASTAKRIATGLATDPVGNIVAEFLPDIAKRINIRVIFVQRILNAVTAGSNSGSVVTGP